MPDWCLFKVGPWSELPWESCYWLWVFVQPSLQRLLVGFNGIHQFSFPFNNHCFTVRVRLEQFEAASVVSRQHSCLSPRIKIFFSPLFEDTLFFRLSFDKPQLWKFDLRNQSKNHSECKKPLKGKTQFLMESQLKQDWGCTINLEAEETLPLALAC